MLLRTFADRALNVARAGSGFAMLAPDPRAEPARGSHQICRSVRVLRKITPRSCVLPRPTRTGNLARWLPSILRSLCLSVVWRRNDSHSDLSAATISMNWRRCLLIVRCGSSGTDVA